MPRTWSIRFRGRDARETLARADLFFLQNQEAIGLPRELFFSRLVLSEDGTQAAYVGTESSWEGWSGEEAVEGSSAALAQGGEEEPAREAEPAPAPSPWEEDAR